MKAIAEINRRQMSTAVAVAPLPKEDFDYQRPPLGKPRRLRAVSPMELPTRSESIGVEDVELDAKGLMSGVATHLVIRPTFTQKAKVKRLTTPMLTTEEFIQVRLATVRESTRHCYWPADVVARFAAADVIR